MESNALATYATAWENYKEAQKTAKATLSQAIDEIVNGEFNGVFNLSRIGGKCPLLGLDEFHKLSSTVIRTISNGEVTSMEGLRLPIKGLSCESQYKIVRYLKHVLNLLNNAN